MHRGWLAAGLPFLVLLGCKAEVRGAAHGEAELAASSDRDQAPATSGEDDTPAERAAEPRPRAAREMQAPARWEGPPMATYPGFQIFDDGTSRVFLEVAGGRVNVKERQSQAGVYRYRFEGVQVPARVNRLALPTVHFETPVARIELLQIGGDAELVIHLRDPVRPYPRVKRSDGSTVLSVDFPHPSAAAPRLHGAPSASPNAATIEVEVPSEP